jgi:hypothetical protein
MWDVLQRCIDRYVGEAADICERLLPQEVSAAQYRVGCATRSHLTYMLPCRAMGRDRHRKGCPWQPASRQQQSMQEIGVLSHHRHLPCACCWVATRTAKHL